MIRKLFKTLFAIAMIFCFVAPVYAVTQDMWAYVYTWDGTESKDGKKALVRAITGITYKVLSVDSDSAETLTIYNDETFTSLTNPITTTVFAVNTTGKDMVAFRVDPTDTTNDRYVDLIVTNTVGGYTAFVRNFDKYTHSIVIEQQPNVMHHGIIWFAAASASQTDTGIDFEYDTALSKVVIEVVVADAGGSSTLNVGIADGTAAVNGAAVYAINVSMAATGYVVQSASNMGEYLDDGTNNLVHVIDGSDDASLQYDQVLNLTAGYIHYFFTRVRR